MLFNCVVIIAKKQTAYCNPFRPVETRLNLSKHVSIRSDLSRPVSRLPPLPSSIPPPPSPPFSPLLPLFPFLFGGGGRGGRGREGGGRGSTTMAPPEGGGGGRSPPPPPPDFKQKTIKILAQNLQIFKICVIYPYPLKVSLSPLLLKTT